MKNIVKFETIFSCFGFVALLALSGCAHYRPVSVLQPISEKTNKKLGQQNAAVSFEYKIFDKKDCMAFLDRDVISLGYQPIQITIKNNSNKHLKFCTKDFSFFCAEGQDVAQRAHTNTKARAAGYGTAALFFPIFAIPAIVDGIGSSESNKDLDIDFHRKSLRDQVIAPLSQINGLVFVPVNAFDPEFQFELTDVKTKKKYTLGSFEQAVTVA